MASSYMPVFVRVFPLAVRSMEIRARRPFSTRADSTTQPRGKTALERSEKSIPSRGKPLGPPSTEHDPIDTPSAGRLQSQFDVRGKVFVVTGGGRGLGLTLAEGLAEAGGKVHCLDRLPKPYEYFKIAQRRADRGSGGSLHYAPVDVCDSKNLHDTVERIAAIDSRLDGLIAAAGVQQITPALEYTAQDITKMLEINYTGVFMSATAVAEQMMKYRCRGSIVLIASISGFVANKGLISPVYNSSKAAIIQLGRCLAMEWGKVNEEGAGGIRVNSLCPGHIITPMVEENFAQVPGLREIWEKENMLGRLSLPEEFKGASLFLLSNASSFVTGSSLVVDGGHTAW